VPSGGRGLDVGCGSGHRTVDFALHMDSVVGIDLSPPLIELARERRARVNVEFQLADLRTFEDQQGFDLVYSANTLHHIEPLEPALTRLRGLVRPGGWAVLTDNVARQPAWVRWLWLHGAYRLAALQDVGRGRSGGLRGMWQYYRFETSRPWVAHMKSDHYLRPDEFDAVYGSVFPEGRVLHQGLATLVWQRPLIRSATDSACGSAVAERSGAPERSPRATSPVVRVGFSDRLQEAALAARPRSRTLLSRR
jgi:SAM-dependent methyltransferase